MSDAIHPDKVPCPETTKISIILNCSYRGMDIEIISPECIISCTGTTSGPSRIENSIVYFIFVLLNSAAESSMFDEDKCLIADNIAKTTSPTHRVDGIARLYFDLCYLPTKHWPALLSRCLTVHEPILLSACLPIYSSYSTSNTLLVR